MQTPLNIQLINQVCWEHFRDLRGDENQVFLSDLNKKTLTWLEGQPISILEALILLERWITESLQKHGKVILYTCRDNSEIAIEDPGEVDEEDLEYYEKYSDTLVDLPFYIGYD